MDGPFFIAGATGYTGREVVRILCEKGIETIAHVRHDSPRLDDWKKTFGDIGAAVDATPWDKLALRRRLQEIKPAAVFGLLGTVRARAKQARREGRNPADESYYAVDYRLTSLLLDASLASGNRPLFVYLSATGVGAKSISAYYRARHMVETELIDSQLPALIARPSFIVGSDRDDHRPGEKFGAALSDASLVFAGLVGAKKIRDRYLSTTNTELAEALVRLALEPADGVRIVEAELLRSPKD